MAFPNGNIYLLDGIPLDNTYEHTILFSSKSEQLAYFNSKIKKMVPETQYIKKKDSIMVPYLLDEIASVNYMFYRSKNDSKLHYCFVRSKRYQGEDVTELDVELDVMQTYMFDYQLKPSFVERGHVDRWGSDLTPAFSYTEEGLDYGKEYITESAMAIVHPDNVMWFLCLMSHSSEFHEGLTAPSNLNDVPVPYIPYLIPHYIGNAKKSFTINENKIANINDFMVFMGDSAIGTAVKEIAFIPYLPFNLTVSEGGVISNNESGLVLAVDKLEAKDSWLGSIAEIFTGNDDASINLLRIDAKSSSYSSIRSLITIPRDDYIDILYSNDWSSIRSNSKKSKFDKRTESKLLCHPYRYNILCNWKTQPLILKNEYLPEQLDIRMAKSLSFNSSARYWVEGYKGDPHGRSNSLIENTRLELPIISDTFYEYQLQNKIQSNTSLVTGLIGTVGGVALGVATGGVGAVLGVNAALGQGTNVANQIAKQADLKNIPDSIVNSNDSSLSIADQNIYLTYYKYKIDEDSSDRLANYWHMFGYKVNKLVDVAEFIKTRERFNYVKTTAINMSGSFDQEDLIAIKDNFNKGITFWHYYEGFEPLNYEYNNLEKILK